MIDDPSRRWRTTVRGDTHDISGPPKPPLRAQVPLLLSAFPSPVRTLTHTALNTIVHRAVKAKPKPLRRDASVWSTAGKLGSYCARLGGETRASLTAVNASSWHGIQTNGLRCFNKSRNGRAAKLIWSVKSPSWLTRPMKDQSSVMLVGIGNFWMARILLGFAAIPYRVTTYPTNLTSSSANWNLDALRVIPCSRHLVSSCHRRLTWSGKAVWYARTSSTTFCKLSMSANDK